MSNDPKDAKVDLSKLKKEQTPNLIQNPISNVAPNMITICNEEANLIDVLSPLNKQCSQMIGIEYFSEDVKKGCKKSE